MQSTTAAMIYFFFGFVTWVIFIVVVPKIKNFKVTEDDSIELGAFLAIFLVIWPAAWIFVVCAFVSRLTIKTLNKYIFCEKDD